MSNALAIPAPIVNKKPQLNLLTAQFPEKLAALFKPMRYKILYGGRGGAKSWSIARALLLLGQIKPMRIVCGREIMDSISGSVHKLLSDQIHELGLDDYYSVFNNKIVGLNGTEFTFIGLHHNTTKIRSLEGVDVFWVEEAQTVSTASWDVLIPTIRKEGSEIWISFNPELDTDETYKRFVLNPPTDSVLMEVNWRDNPWFSPLLQKERLDKRGADPDGYLTTWEGKTRQTLDGAVYARELRAATLANRITRVPLELSRPVSTFWDIGRADKTSIWFAQIVGFDFRIIDFYENSQHHIDHYMQVLQERGYTYLHHWLPHDAQAKTIGTKLSVEEQMRAKGFPVKIVKQLSIADGINAVRTIFPNCWFDEIKCADGLQCLRRYQYEVDQETKQFSNSPKHNEWSHACLIAGEMVNTLRGTVPIESVKVGDSVWTPSGISLVKYAGPVKHAVELIEIHVATGRLLTCTPEHKILTKRGFVKASELRLSDLILTGKEWPCRLIGLVSMVGTLGFREVITGKTSGDQKDQAICIEPSMNTFMGRFLKATTSTIKTTIHSITAHTIWSASLATTISQHTPKNEFRLDNSSRHQRPLWKKLLNGTDHKKVIFGIPNTGKKHGKTESGMRPIVSIAAKLLLRLIPLAPNSATKIAKLQHFDCGAEGPFVYDLTVQKNQCYQVNGILVSNSDAFRYLALGLRDKEKPPKTESPRLPRPRLSSNGWMG